MKLNELIKNLRVKQTYGNLDVDIGDIQIDSNQVGNSTLFICIKGNDFDGHDFVRQIESYGAVAIVCQKKLNTCLPQVVVENSREAMSILARDFYGNVDKKMKLIGVIGTNGKTTTAHMVAKVLEKAGESCGLIGTLGTYYKDVYIEPKLTTPDPIELTTGIPNCRL